MDTCTKVFLRRKEISGGRLSLYLDFYPPIRNPHTNRLSRREGLGIYLYANPQSAREREFNASMEEKAEAIRCRRFEQLLNEQFGFLDKEKMRMDFLEYFRKKCYKKHQKWKVVYEHFSDFCRGKCLLGEVLNLLSVELPTMPSALSPLSVWKRLTAAVVREPHLPSTVDE